MVKSNPKIVRELLDEYAQKKKTQAAGFVDFRQRSINTRDNNLDKSIEDMMDAELKKIDLFCKKRKLL